MGPSLYNDLHPRIGQVMGLCCVFVRSQIPFTSWIKAFNCGTNDSDVVPRVALLLASITMGYKPKKNRNLTIWARFMSTCCKFGVKASDQSIQVSGFFWALFFFDYFPTRHHRFILLPPKESNKYLHQHHLVHKFESTSPVNQTYDYHLGIQESLGLTSVHFSILEMARTYFLQW